MSFQEKSTWAMGAITIAVYAGYFAVLLGRVGEGSVSEIDYQPLMLTTVLALVVLAVVSHILIAAANPREADRTDVRDREINRFGEYVGGYVLAAGALAALAMAMIEVQYFWIANAILLALVLSELVSLGTKAVLYRRGI